MAQFPTAPRGSMINGNDDRHNLPDPNMGGSPQGMFSGNAKKVPIKQRGSFGMGGQKVYDGRSTGPTRYTVDNPANRGGFKGQARGGAFSPDKRVPGHGGSPQHRERESSNFAMRQSNASNGQGGVNKHAPGKVPTGPSTDKKPTAGNTSGRSFKLIAGRFKRAPMGARPSAGDNSGKYGSAPVSANT